MVYSLPMIALGAYLAATAKPLRSEYEGVTFRSPRLGVEGCCGRGCNGCLHFWNEPRYAKARQLLRSKPKFLRLN